MRQLPPPNLMSKQHLVIAVAGLAVGWFAANQLAQYKPFDYVAGKAASLA